MNCKRVIHGNYDNRCKHQREACRLYRLEPPACKTVSVKQKCPSSWYKVARRVTILQSLFFFKSSNMLITTDEKYFSSNIHLVWHSNFPSYKFLRLFSCEFITLIRGCSLNWDSWQCREGSVLGTLQFIVIFSKVTCL